MSGRKLFRVHLIKEPQFYSMLNSAFIPFPVLKTERLVLRQLMMDDAEGIFLLRSDGEVNKYLARKPAQAIDDAKDFITRINENSSKNNSVYWAISLNDSNRLIGTICLYSFSDDHSKCEIGYELLPEFQGRGIMSETLQKVIDYAFNVIEVQRVEAFFHRDNHKTQKLLEKFSFKGLKKMDKNEPDLKCYCLEGFWAKPGSL